MYFLMAGKDAPLASFKPLTAAMTIVAVGGWAGAALGLAAFLAGDFFAASGMILMLSERTHFWQ